VATWDDHETSDNAFGRGSVENTGALNHQTVCPVNVSSPIAMQLSSSCDRDEGDVGVRFNNAAQAYMEWMPLRRGPGTMGVATITSITNVMEWGDLATFVRFDTRISYRTKQPTGSGDFVDAFEAPAVQYFNISAYSDPSTPEYAAFSEVATSVRNQIHDPSNAIAGENIHILRDAWQASTNAGKTWQIWANPVAVASQIFGSLSRLAEFANDTSAASLIQNYVDFVFSVPAAAPYRALVAMDVFQIPWSTDDYSAATFERDMVLEIASQTNNPIILSGDVHDAWAWVLYENGNKTDTPVAVNLVAPAVTSPGIANSLRPAFDPNPLDPILGEGWWYDAFERVFLGINPGLKYGNIKNKGFFAVKATKVWCARYYHLFMVIC